MKRLGNHPWHKRNYKSDQFCDEDFFPTGFTNQIHRRPLAQMKGAVTVPRVKNEFPCLALQFTASAAVDFSPPSRTHHHSRGESLTHLSARGTFSRRSLLIQSREHFKDKNQSKEFIRSSDAREFQQCTKGEREREKKTERDEGFVLLTFLILSPSQGATPSVPAA
jgi:hypothetical protein